MRMCRAGLREAVVHPDFRACERLCELTVGSRDWSTEKKNNTSLLVMTTSRLTT